MMVLNEVADNLAQTELEAKLKTVRRAIAAEPYAVWPPSVMWSSQTHHWLCCGGQRAWVRFVFVSLFGRLGLPDIVVVDVLRLMKRDDLGAVALHERRLDLRAVRPL